MTMEKSSYILETMSLPVSTQGCFLLLLKCISLRVSSNVRLCLQVLFTLTFWLLVRQSVKENFSKKRKVVSPLEDVRTGQPYIKDDTKALSLLGGKESPEVGRTSPFIQ